MLNFLSHKMPWSWLMTINFHLFSAKKQNISKRVALRWTQQDCFELCGESLPVLLWALWFWLWPSGKVEMESFSSTLLDYSCFVVEVVVIESKASCSGAWPFCFADDFPFSTRRKATRGERKADFLGCLAVLSQRNIQTSKGPRSSLPCWLLFCLHEVEIDFSLCKEGLIWQ